MSLLTVGQTIWSLREPELRLMIEQTIAKISKTRKTRYLNRTIKNTTVKEMIREIKETYIHKIDKEMDEFLTLFDDDSSVLAVNIRDWGWIYYIQNLDGHWNLVFDKEHPMCREYALEDFSCWVKRYGVELADIMADEIAKATTEESPFATVPNITSSLTSVRREGDTIFATIELEED